MKFARGIIHLYYKYWSGFLLLLSLDSLGELWGGLMQEVETQNIPKGR